MKMEKKLFLQCDGRTDCQTVRGDERKMKSPGESRGGQGRGGEKIVKLFYRRDN